MMRVLIDAGGNPDSRLLDGATPMYLAAQEGHVNAIKVLLLVRARANPLLSNTIKSDVFVPLYAAARCGHSEVVLELIQQLV